MLIRLENPTGTIVGIDELRDALRAPAGTDDDATLLSLLKAQTRRYEDFTGRLLLPVRLEARLPGWTWPLCLPAVPIRAVEEVAYLDTDDAEQVLDPGLWFTVPRATGWEVHFVEDADLPALGRRPDPVRIRFEAGHDDPAVFGSGSAELQPDPADRVHVLMLVRRIYDEDAEMEETEMRARMGHRRVLR